MSLAKVLFSFNGRIPRSIFWYYQLAYVAIVAAGMLIDGATGLVDRESGFGCIGALVMLVGLITGLAVSVKRAHDLGHSGWWLLLGLFPQVGLLIFFELGCLKGTVRPTKYGPALNRAPALQTA